MTQMRRVQGIPNIVLIGVPNERSLSRVKEKLASSNVGYFCWTEPDYDLGFTAIATTPLAKDEKQFLSHYRLWNHTCRCSSEKEQPVLAGRSGVQFIPAAPNTPVVQFAEQPEGLTASREMEGQDLPGVPNSFGASSGSSRADIVKHGLSEMTSLRSGSGSVADGNVIRADAPPILSAPLAQR